MFIHFSFDTLFPTSIKSFTLDYLIVTIIYVCIKIFSKLILFTIRTLKLYICALALMLLYSIHCGMESTIRICLAICRPISTLLFMHYQIIVAEYLFASTWMESALDLYFWEEVSSDSMRFSCDELLATIRAHHVWFIPFLGTWSTECLLANCALFRFKNDLITY